MKKIILLLLFIHVSIILMAQSPLVVANSSTNVSCYGLCDGTASATAYGGTPPYDYLWNSVPVQTNAAAIGLCAGSYTCTVTDSIGNTVKTYVTITQPSAVIVTSAGASFCPNQCATLNSNSSGGTPPYNYSWAPVGLTTASVSVCPGSTTVYSITTTDAHGCTGNTSVQVTVDPKIILNAAGIDATICNVPCNGQTIVIPSGGVPPYTYSWSGGCSSAACNNICAGTYTVITTDGFGCTQTATATVSCPSGIEEQTRANGIVKFFPNPFTDNTTFTIQSKNLNGNYSFELVDVLGKQVKSITEINTKQFQVSRNGLPNGIYFYKIYTSESIIGIGKLVVE